MRKGYLEAGNILLNVIYERKRERAILKRLYFFSEECAALDLDGQGGRTFLRVLLHLAMHDYPPLVSGALHLLFRHFSQRQEVLQAFKQVGFFSSILKHIIKRKILLILMFVVNRCNSWFRIAT